MTPVVEGVGDVDFFVWRDFAGGDNKHFTVSNLKGCIPLRRVKCVIDVGGKAQGLFGEGAVGVHSDIVCGRDKDVIRFVAVR